MLSEDTIKNLVQKVMKGSRVVLSDLGPPEVVVANTYFWDAWRSPESCRAYKIVREWIDDVAYEFDIPLVCKKEEKLKIYCDEKEVGYFYYVISGRNVHKKQSFSAITKIVTDKINSLKSSIEMLMRSGYDEARALRIVVAQNKGIDVLKFVKPGYESYHVYLVRKLLEKGIDPSFLPVAEFNENQVVEILKGLDSGLDVKIYAQPFLESHLMAAIRKFMEKGKGIYVEALVRPEILDYDLYFKDFLRIFKKHEIKTEENFREFLSKLFSKVEKGKKLKPPYDKFYSFLMKLHLNDFQKNIKERQKNKKTHRSLKI